MYAIRSYYEDIVKPLGMKDTFYIPSKEQAERMFVRDKSNEKYLNGIIDGTNIYLDDSWKNIGCTGWGLKSTPFDLVRFGNMLLNNGTLDGTRIIGRKAVEKMTAKALHNVPDFCWGCYELDREFRNNFV